MSMELILTNSELSIPTEIANLQALKEELIPRVQKYSALVVTEDGIQAAKKDKAALNKFKDILESRRKEIKAQCLEPYNRIEGQFKELVALIDGPVQAIDRQVKNFETQKKQEKYSVLQEHFDKENTLDFLKLEDVLDPKWGNVTAKEDKLKEGISTKIKAITEDFESLKEMYSASPLLPAIIERFAQTKDKNAAIAYAALLENRERVRQNEVTLKAVSNPAERVEPKPEPEPLISGGFKVSCTRKQLVGLRDYMLQNGIKFKYINIEEE